MTDTADKILMAEIAGAHGVKGAVKLKIFAEDPESLVDYPPLTDAAGKREFQIEYLHMHGKIWTAEFEGITDRSQAEKLLGTKLYVSRNDLPEIEDEGTYYHADLIGLAARHTDGTDMGRILNVTNFGAGDLLEIKPVKGNSYYIPFTNACVPTVDIKNKLVTIEPPPGLLDPPKAEDKDGENDNEAED